MSTLLISFGSLVISSASRLRDGGSVHHLRVMVLREHSLLMGFRASAFKHKHTQAKSQLNLWIWNLFLHCDLFLETAAGPFYPGHGKMKTGVSSTLGRHGWSLMPSVPWFDSKLDKTQTISWKCESCSVVSDSLWPHGLYSPWNSPGQSTGVRSLSLLQGIFPTQGSNPGLPHCRWIIYQLNHKGSPRIQEWVAYPFSSGSSWPRNRTRVSCIVGGFFTNWAIQEARLIVK